MVEIVTGALIGYRLVKDAKFVLSIAAYVKNYQGYNSEDNKQDDRAMRNWIMESTNGLRTHAMNLMETGYWNDDDNLDLFKNEVNLASTKDAQSVWTKVSDDDFDNLVEFDLKVVEGIGQVKKIMAELEIEVTSDGENKTKLLGEAKSGITTARNHFIERMQYVGGFK